MTHLADALPDDETRLRPRGSSQGGLRQYNERVVLQAIRLHGALPSAEIARLTRLTAQTISLITKRLLDDGLLLKGAPQRGKVGQPSVPLRLNPDGAYAIGIKVGRRSLDVLLVDFTGTIRRRWTLDYRFADPDVLIAEIGLRLNEIAAGLDAVARERVQGIGIAAPLSMGGWQQLLGFPAEVADRWSRFDLATEVARLTPWPVEAVKDTAAPCVAELVAGRGGRGRSLLFVFFGTLLARGPRTPPPARLLSVPSLLTPEQLCGGAGLDATAAVDARALEPPWREITGRWLEQAGAAIAQAVNSAVCLLDLDDVIVDGSFSRELLGALLRETEQALSRYSWEGVARPQLSAGTIGSDARALGGALLPLYANFAPDRELFLKVGT